MNANRKKELRKAYKLLDDGMTIICELADEIKNEFDEMDNQYSQSAAKKEAESEVLVDVGYSIQEILELVNEEFKLGK